MQWQHLLRRYLLVALTPIMVELTRRILFSSPRIAVPAWILVDPYPDNGPRNSRIVWIPTLENMLEDALLMIAVYVCKDDGILELIKGFGIGIESGTIELYSDTTESQRRQLYERCREIPGFPKIVISVFKESSVGKRQLSLLENYTMDVEVCTPIYSRGYSHWRDETWTEGSLG